MKKLISIIALSIASNFCLQADPMATDTVWTKFLGNDAIVQSVKFSPDGQFIYAGVEKYNPIKISTETGEIVQTYENEYFEYKKYIDYEYELDITSDGQYLVIGRGEAYKAIVLDTETGELFQELNFPEEIVQNAAYPAHYIESVSFSPTNNIVAITAVNFMNSENPPEYILIYDYLTGELLQTIESGDLKKAVFSPDGSKLGVISTHNNNRVWYYNTTDWSEVKLGSTSYYGTDIAFSPDGSKLASCGWDGYIRIWDVNEKSLVKEILFHENNNNLYAINYSIDGKYIFVVNMTFKSSRLRTYSTSSYNIVSDLDLITDLSNYKALNTIDSRVSDNINFIVGGANKGIIKFKIDKVNTINSIKQLAEATILPNPNTSLSTISITLPNAENIEIKIVNQEGIEIGIIFSGILEAGEHNFTWDGSNYPSGVYYCRITGRNINETLKIIKVE